MAVHFDHKVYYFEDEEDFINNYRQFSSHPDKCPICKFGINPEYILVYFKKEIYAEILCGCPREDCGALFFVEYIDKINNPFEQTTTYEINKYYPSTKTVISFSDEIEMLFPNFVLIYQQAYHAEQEGLDLICGVGYRKALEYLIKEYAIDLHSEEDKLKIERMPLQQCITKYISHPTIKDMAKRAVWLGNDETHLVREWENQDIQDLKKLINLTVHFISMELLAVKYENEMEISSGKLQ